MAVFRAGFARVDITVQEPDFAMFGWGRPDHRARGAAMPLFARAMVLEDTRTTRRIAYVCCDLGMMSESVYRHVVERVSRADLGLARDAIMVTATHTHSGPSGFSTYLFYGMSGPGFSRHVHDVLVDAIVQSIEEAARALAPARLYAHRDEIPLHEPVAFNRALAAYRNNVDMPAGTGTDPARAVDRSMTVLRVDHEDGAPMGLVSWFGVHGTSVHPDDVNGPQLHGDNKGEAALQTEEAYAQEAQARRPVVAIFAQGAPGDVTPNDQMCPRRKVVVGRGADDFESARQNGEIQSRYARRFARAAIDHELTGHIEARARYADFAKLEVAPEFIGGRRGVHTGPAVLGFGAGLGTAEGPGPFYPARVLFPPTQRLFDALRHLRVRARGRDPVDTHGRLVPFWELGKGSQGRMFGVLPSEARALDRFGTQYMKYAQKAFRESDARDHTLVPRYLCAQVLQLGELVVAGLPVEPTVTSGRRLTRALVDALPQEPRFTVVNGYANAYASYLTTPEEYQEQLYEGASTFYGQWSLPAWCTLFTYVARSFHDARSDLGPVPELPDLGRALPAQLS